MGQVYRAILAEVFCAGFTQTRERRVYVPPHVRDYRAPSNTPFFLSDFLEKNANTPTHPEDLAREAEYQTQARRKHDEALVRIAQEPQRYTPGLPKDLKIYTEVRLPLDGEKRRWPLTVVDIIGHSDDRCYLWGVVAYENRGTLRRDLKSIREARKYLFYNFGVESTLIMASGQREQIEALPVIEAELPPEHQAILRWR